MKFITALQNVTKTPANTDHIDPDDVANLANVNSYDIDYDLLNKRIKAYWLVVWNCTDTWVGLCAIYVDGKLVGSSYQHARKAQIDFSFISKECAEMFIDAVRASCIPAEPAYDIASAEELDEDLAEFYTLHNTGSFVENIAYYKGMPVKVKHGYGYSTDAVIFSLVDGESSTVSASDVQFKIRTDDAGSKNI